MLDPSHPIAKLLKEDRRYKIDAYAFVFEALNFAHSQLGHGRRATGRRRGRGGSRGSQRPRRPSGT